MTTQPQLREIFTQVLDEREEDRCLREAEQELARLSEAEYQQQYGAIGAAILRWVSEDAATPPAYDWRHLTAAILGRLQEILMPPPDPIPALRHGGEPQSSLGEALVREGLDGIAQGSGWMLARNPLSRDGRTAFHLIAARDAPADPQVRILDPEGAEIPPSASRALDIGRPAWEILIGKEIDAEAGIDIALAPGGALLLRVTPRSS